MLAKDLRQMLAEALRIGHARCVVLCTIERHTDTLSSGWFHGSDSPYGAVCSIHSIRLEVESSYCLHRFPPTKGSGQIRAKIYAKLEPFPVQEGTRELREVFHTVLRIPWG